MIHVDRRRVPRPPVLSSPRAQAARAEYEKYIKTASKKRAQREAPFDFVLLRQTVGSLLELFRNKCAYCESPVPDRAAMDLEMFRPKARAINLDGAVDTEGYWWLAYEWENLYCACRNCNRLKGSRFPVAGERAKPRATGKQLAAEKALLLDPCLDAPEDFLVFTDDGRVVSESERGRVTIEILGLNRDALVKDRLQSIEKTRSAFAAANVVRPKKFDFEFWGAGDEAPFAGARRQVLARLLEALPTGPVSNVLKAHLKENVIQIAADFESAQQAQEAYSIADEAGKTHYFAKTRLISRIEIRNFRPIEELTLAFPEPSAAIDAATQTLAPGPPSLSPWLMLLGENASGKSSVLQAVALTLVGEEWRNRLELPPASQFVRRGATEGLVRVHLTGSSHPIELRFNNASTQFESEPKEPKVLLLGYGATRLLPRPGAPAPGTYDFARIDNLFNPFIPLNDAAGWMSGLREDIFDVVSEGLRSILQLSGDDRLEQVDGTIQANILGNRVTLQELSDGYQSVLALATDVMRVMLKRWPAMDIAEGIVILDEVGSHLHPRWRMRIVEALRRSFPRVQFLASTHDPLCLRGLGTGEVVVMQRDSSHKVVAITDLPPIGGLRVDQLLTSEYFGLNSTVDPQVEKLFQEYYQLLAARTRTPAQEKRLAALKTELDQLRMLGGDQRERLMLEAIDTYLADEKTRPRPEASTRRAAVREKLADIWRDTPAAKRPARGVSRS